MGKKENNIEQSLKELFELLIKSTKSMAKLIDNCDFEHISDIKKDLNEANILKRVLKLDEIISDKLLCQDLKNEELNINISFFKITTEVARISGVIRTALGKFEQGCDDLKDDDIKKLTKKLYLQITSVLKLTLEMITTDELDDIDELYREIIALEEKIDNIYSKITDIVNKKNKKLSKNESILKALRVTEKIASRAVSISQIVRFPCCKDTENNLKG